MSEKDMEIAGIERRLGDWWLANKAHGDGGDMLDWPLFEGCSVAMLKFLGSCPAPPRINAKKFIDH
jgi:hypothetical protein